VKNPASWLAAACLLPAVIAAAAQPQNLTLRDAIVRAAARNPDLAHFAFELAAQDARIEQAGQLPPLNIHAALDNFAGSGASSWLSGAELTLSLSRVVELGGQAQRRADVATRQREQVDVSRKAAQLDTLAEVARRFIHVASDQEQLQLTQLATALAEDTLAEVTRHTPGRGGAFTCGGTEPGAHRAQSRPPGTGTRRTRAAHIAPAPGGNVG
jgi:outer membrane protein, heavy metal efflux system